MSNKITYNTENDFYNGIYELTTRGLTFEANFHSLTITLTGGF